MKNDPASFIEAGKVFACGKDPYFPAWPDVLQLGAFQPALRQEVVDTVSEIAERCDGVRCDMAMLMLNNIFEGTQELAQGKADRRILADGHLRNQTRRIRSSVSSPRHVGTSRVGTAAKGFDFCYDKKLYDRMESENPESVRLHLTADPSYQDKMMRFLENYSDEPRAAAAFPDAKQRADAVAFLT